MTSVMKSVNIVVWQDLCIHGPKFGDLTWKSLTDKREKREKSVLLTQIHFKWTSGVPCTPDTPTHILCVRDGRREVVTCP